MLLHQVVLLIQQSVLSYFELATCTALARIAHPFIQEKEKLMFNLLQTARQSHPQQRIRSPNVDAQLSVVRFKQASVVVLFF